MIRAPCYRFARPNDETLNFDRHVREVDRHIRDTLHDVMENHRRQFV